MQAISKGKHVQMINALFQLEELLGHDEQNCSYVKLSADYRRELETMQINYQSLLGNLAEHISAYEALSAYVKVHFLGKKLKELKKHIPPNNITSIPAPGMLHHNIQLIYGT